MESSKLNKSVGELNLNRNGGLGGAKSTLSFAGQMMNTSRDETAGGSSM
jgi:hypothetical protein